MSEDSRTLWVGNLEERVTEGLIYELFLQTGPIERLILPSEVEGDKKKHMGHAYVVFRHPESIQYASQILEGSSLFGLQLSMKARSLPITYKSTAPGNKGRFDNNPRPSFNKATTWHGQNELSTRGRGGFRNQGGGSNHSQNTGYNASFNNYNNQVNSGYWVGGQQAGTDTQATTYNTSDDSLEDKRQRLLQKQNITLEAHRQVKPGVMNTASQVYGVVQQFQSQQQQQQQLQSQPQQQQQLQSQPQQQQLQSQQQQQQQQGMWTTGSYNSDNWNMNNSDTSAYQSYPTNQYGNWYQQQ